VIGAGKREFDFKFRLDLQCGRLLPPLLNKAWKKPQCNYVCAHLIPFWVIQPELFICEKAFEEVIRFAGHNLMKSV